MKLFDETESKYYELISYLLLQKRGFTGKDIERLYEDLFQGVKDFETLEAFFSTKEGEETVFHFIGGKYCPIVESEFPVRCNMIEQQAFNSLCDLKYANRFLSEETLLKIRRQKDRMMTDWSIRDIEVKNQFVADKRSNGNSDKKLLGSISHDDNNKLRIIMEAIRKNRSIIYDNVKDDTYEYRDETAFPVKIEYSFLNDAYRVSAYHPFQDRFFMMTLDTMRNIRHGNEYRADIQKEYEAFLARDRKRVVLDVEPVGHVIERCFRIFSYFERKAVYNREDEKYRLEIMYNSFDEAEIVRNILSMGSSVVVLEPMTMRRRIRDRIMKAANI